jgi:hypothetical protein
LFAIFPLRKTRQAFFDFLVLAHQKNRGCVKKHTQTVKRVAVEKEGACCLNIRQRLLFLSGVFYRCVAFFRSLALSNFEIQEEKKETRLPSFFVGQENR